MLPAVEAKIADLKQWKLHIVIISPNEAHSTKDFSKTDPTNLKNLSGCSYGVEGCNVTTVFSNLLNPFPE